MERELIQKVDIIKSQSGVNVYSSLEFNGAPLQRTQKDYGSWQDAERKIMGEMMDRYQRSRTLKSLQFGEVVTVGVWALEGLSKISDTQSPIYWFLPLAIAVSFLATKFAADLNTNQSILTKNRYYTVDEAQKVNLPQYQKEFKLRSKQDPH